MFCPVFFSAFYRLISKYLLTSCILCWQSSFFPYKSSPHSLATYCRSWEPVFCGGLGNGNPLQCSCLENPRDGGAWWAAVYGVTQSRTRLKRLSSSRDPLPPDFLMDLTNKMHCERLRKTGEREGNILSANLSGDLLLPAVKRFASS